MVKAYPSAPTIALVLFASMFSPVLFQQAPPKQADSQQPDYLQKAALSSIFVYDSTLKPCESAPPNMTIAPLGSAFVVGITNKKTTTPQLWSGWKFLITAKHVIGDRTQIIARLNLANKAEFTCQSLDLKRIGTERNVFLAGDGIDLVAIGLPNIPGTDPLVFGYSFLLDEPMMKDWHMGVGTHVFTVGYLLGYSGEKANFPVTKFGDISVITAESWYYNSESRLKEQGYVVELPNAPGLSGAPLMTHGFEFQSNPFRFRELPPYVVGVVKGMLLVSVNGSLISQGLAVVEPGSNLRALIKQIADMLKAGGEDVDLQ